MPSRTISAPGSPCPPTSAASRANGTRAGVVIPSNSTLYLSPNVNAFRTRATGPRRGQGLFVQGNYDRRLSARGASEKFSKTSAR